MSASSQTRFFWVCCLVICLIAFYTRFTDYHNRWGLAFDQAHDSLVARYALTHQKVPLLGPFSSAGAFTTGGQWYWSIMLAMLPNSNQFMMPWLSFTFMHVVFVFVILWFGKKVVDRWFGLIIGIIAAVSPAQISQSLNLTNQTPQAFISLLAIIAASFYLQKKQLRYIFLLGVSIGLGSSIHLSGVSVGMFLLLILIFSRSNVLAWLLAGLGIGAAWLPVILVDSQNNFYIFGNMLHYYLVDQYAVSYDILGRRWLSYLFVFLPKEWGFISGGPWVIGGMVIVICTGVFVVSLIRRRLSIFWTVIFSSTFCIIGAIRYLHAPLFSSYLVFLHPFIFMVVAYSVYLIAKLNRTVGVAILIVVCAGSVYRIYPELRGGGNQAYELGVRLKGEIQTLYPNSKFVIYDYHYQSRRDSAVLSLLLDYDNLIDENGIKIGIIGKPATASAGMTLATKRQYSVGLIDLQSSSSAQIKSNEWVSMAPRAVYESTEEWYKDQK